MSTSDLVEFLWHPSVSTVQGIHFAAACIWNDTLDLQVWAVRGLCTYTMCLLTVASLHVQAHDESINLEMIAHTQGGPEVQARCA